MSKASINLLPQQCLDYRRRIRRRFGWSCVSGVALAALSLAYAGAVAADDTRDRLNATLATTRARQGEAERAFTLVTRERNGYLDSARRLHALHNTIRLPERLGSLIEALPAGVYLTDLRAATAPENPAPAAPPPAAKPGAPAPPPPRRPVTLRFELHGFACDYQTLRTYIDTVSRLDTFKNVELVQGTRETRDSVSAIRFRIECRQIEESP